ncbi:MAG: hypothetical protein U9Q68_10065 [Euryarchaeota archaeon]|nr:hypothetical protein [Euryarchaeota archaeon]
MSSDVHHMARKLVAIEMWFCCWRVHPRGTDTGAAKPDAKTRGTGSVLKSGVW